MTVVLEAVQPSSTEASVADKALEQLRAYLEHHPQDPAHVRLVEEEGGKELLVPRVAVDLFARILAHLAAGHGVAVVPSHAVLTTQEAADILNVSRPYFIKVLESGEIEYSTVGKHRRIKIESLLNYMRKDDQRRRKAADELSALTQEMGLD